MLKKSFPLIYKLSLKVSKPFLGLNPNYLTLIGLIFPLLFFVLLVKREFWLAVVALIGSGLDFIDGTVAKLSNKETVFGGWFDSFSDRISDSLIISAFAFAGIVDWKLVLILLTTSLLISYARSRAELASMSKIKFDFGIIERTERIVLVILFLVVYSLFPKTMLAGMNWAETGFVLLII